MREIKFRAWHNETRKMFSWQDLMADKWNVYSFFGNEAWMTGRPSYIWERMEFTGLKDKNGKEIYEGDILKYKGVEFEVTWCNGGFKLIEQASMFNLKVGDFWFSDILIQCQCNGDSNLEEFEVIRTIYENPNLLQGTHT